MGNLNSINKINFENMQDAITKKDHIIINTLDINNQDCLILGTISPQEEIKILNAHLKNTKDAKIIVYGANCNDDKILTKYKQLINLGFSNTYIYLGGMFEWLLMQEIYGDEYGEFPTTSKELDILKYKAKIY